MTSQTIINQLDNGINALTIIFLKKHLEKLIHQSFSKENKQGLKELIYYIETNKFIDSNLPIMIKCVLDLITRSTIFVETSYYPNIHKIITEEHLKDFTKELREEEIIKSESQKIFKELKKYITTLPVAIKVLDIFNSYIKVMNDDNDSDDETKEHVEFNNYLQSISKSTVIYVQFQIDMMQTKIDYLNASIIADKSIDEVCKLSILNQQVSE